MGSDISGLDLSRKLFFRPEDWGTKRVAYYHIAIITHLSGPRLSISDISTCRTKVPFHIHSALFYPVSFVMAEKPAAAKCPRTSVPMTVKKKICAYKHHHLKATQEEIKAIALKEDHLDIGRSTISDILQESKKWLSTEDSSSTKKSEGRYTQLEEALWIWFGNIRSRHLAILDEMLRVKVKKFGESMGITGLTYSSGWLQGFKKRHGIRVRVTHREAASTNMKVVEEGRRKLRKTLSEFPQRTSTMWTKQDCFTD